MHRMPNVGDLIRGPFLPIDRPSEIDAGLVIMVTPIRTATVVDYILIDSSVSVIDKETYSEDVCTFAIDVADEVLGVDRVDLATVELVNSVRMKTGKDGKTYLT